MDARELSQLLARDAEAVVHRLLPNGKRRGREWLIGSVQGEPGESLSVCLEGSKAGLWSDFATGQAGDLLDLWREVHGVTMAATLQQVRQYAGISDPVKFHSPSHGSKKSYQRPQVVAQKTLTGRILEYLMHERGLSEETIQAFRISQTDRDEIVFPYWRENELIMAKFLGLERHNGKKEFRCTASSEPCLFGWQVISPNARQLIITEGELDAMSLYQLGFPAVSVPFGAGTGAKHTWIETEFDNLERFSEILLCFDDDEPGKQAALDVAQRLGLHRCKVVQLPTKDANEALIIGLGAQSIKMCLEGAKSLDPQELKPASVFVEEVIQTFYPSHGEAQGCLLPWWSTHKQIQLRSSELSIWTGINGHGKSQVLGHVILELMNQEQRVCMASMEIKPARLLYRLTRQATATKDPTESYIRTVHDWFNDRLWLFDVVGSTKSARILEVFAYARRRYDIRHFVIDSMMMCGLREDDYQAQKHFVEALCDFKNEFDCHIHLVAHSRKGESEAQAPGKMDVKGTGAITDLADNVFSIWRNKKKEATMVDFPDNPKSKLEPDAKLECSKQRNGEWEGFVKLWFDKASLQYLDEFPGNALQIVRNDRL